MSADRTTGLALTLEQDVRQSVANILATPRGSRPMRPEYGSDLHELIDAPMDAKNRARFAQATITALAAFEPRLRVDRVQVQGGPGNLLLTIRGSVRGTALQVEVPL